MKEVMKEIDKYYLTQIDSIEQNGWEYNNPAIRLYRVDTLEGNEETGLKIGDYIAVKNSGCDSTEFLFDDDDDFDPEKSEEFLKDWAQEWGNNSDVTRLENYRWGLEDPENDEVDPKFDEPCVIVKISDYYRHTPINYASDDGGEVLDFADAEEAQRWVERQEEKRYVLSHNEAGRPDYIIVAA